MEQIMERNRQGHVRNGLPVRVRNVRYERKHLWLFRYYITFMYFLCPNSKLIYYYVNRLKNDFFVP